MKKYIGIDIGGTTIKMALVDGSGTILQRWQIATNIEGNGRYIPAEIVTTIRDQLGDSFVEHEIAGVGIGVPGPVSKDGGTILRAVNLGWENLPLKQILEKELDVPVMLVNDANAAALGEIWVGSAVGKRDLVFITLGTGVGGGIIVDGKIVNGAHSAGGEIGHLPVYSADTRVCGCGNVNCLETFASANGLVKTMRQLQHTELDFTAKQIFEWLKAGNGAARQAVDITVDYLAQAIAGLLNTLDPEEVVIGGGLAEAGDLLLLPLQQRINQYVFPQLREKFLLRQAKLGNDAGLLGAVYLHI
ncbi:ROK family protein [Listeria costaricensis]|uniref:ROK family protein n=1 Tax=Listeria costaricensis TaxID=2026604 RepID=UPI0019697BDA|nr:ROK family protein [Listeria costaricensis]